MTTTIDPARIRRIDENHLNDDAHSTVHIWVTAHYPTLSLSVSTAWLTAADWVDEDDRDDRCHTVVARQVDHGFMAPVWSKEYDPARVTVGVLAEAHEAVCARVEWGELP